MNRILGFGLACGLSLSPIHAQTAPPAKVIPQTPLLVAHVDGPAALRATFLPTNIGKMFAGPEFKELAAPLHAMLEMVRQQAGQAPFDAAALEKGILNYRGRLSVSVHLHGRKVDPRGPEETPWTIGVVLSPDGQTNLEGFVAQSKAMFLGMLGQEAGAESPLKNIKVGDAEYPVVSQGSDPAICLPFMHQGHAIALITTRPEQSLTAWLGEGARHSGGNEVGKASMGVWVNAAEVVAVLRENGPVMAGPMWDAMGAKILAASGLESLVSASMSLGARGPYLSQEMALQFNDKERGYLGVLAPTSAPQQPLTSLLPAGATSASAMPMDLRPIYHTTKRMFAAMGDMAPESWEEIEAAFKREFGADMKTDLVDTLDVGMAFFQAGAVGGLDMANPFSLYEGVALILAAKDGGKLASTMHKIMSKSPAGEPASQAVGNHKVYSVALPMMPQLHFSGAGKKFVLAMGEPGLKSVKALLSAPADQDAAELPTSVSMRLKAVPGPKQGIGWTDMNYQVNNLLDILDLVAAELPPQVEPLLVLAEKMPALMKKYKLGTMADVYQLEGSTMRLIRLW